MNVYLAVSIIVIQFFQFSVAIFDRVTRRTCERHGEEAAGVNLDPFNPGDLPSAPCLSRCNVSRTLMARPPYSQKG
jgi:hypothetical protein